MSQLRRPGSAKPPPLGARYVGNGVKPLYVALADVVTAHNLFPAFAISPPRSHNDFPDLASATYLWNVCGSGITVPVPFKLSKKIFRTFELVAGPKDCLNLTTPNLSGISALFSHEAAFEFIDVRSVLCAPRP